MILDNAPCHKTLKVIQKFQEFKTNVQFVPPRLTNLLQPADVSWFRSIKSEYHKRWTSWYTSDDHAFTKSGNMKSPGYARVIFIKV